MKMEGERKPKRREREGEAVSVHTHSLHHTLHFEFESYHNILRIWITLYYASHIHDTTVYFAYESHLIMIQKLFTYVMQTQRTKFYMNRSRIRAFSDQSIMHKTGNTGLQSSLESVDHTPRYPMRCTDSAKLKHSSRQLPHTHNKNVTSV